MAVEEEEEEEVALRKYEEKKEKKNKHTIQMEKAEVVFVELELVLVSGTQKAGIVLICSSFLRVESPC